MRKVSIKADLWGDVPKLFNIYLIYLKTFPSEISGNLLTLIFQIYKAYPEGCLTINTGKIFKNSRKDSVFFKMTF